MPPQYPEPPNSSFLFIVPGPASWAAASGVSRCASLGAGPGAEIAMFFVIDEALFASIDAGLGGGLLQPGQLAAATRIDRCETARFRRLFASSSDLIVSREGGGA